MGLITFTTDFGTADWFVGAMKGVILGIAPQAVIVDISHGVAPGDVRGGAFALLAGCRFFPKKTVHVAIVDPGVGSRRQAVVVETRDYYFVGPDNGVLSWALAREEVRATRLIENEKYFRHPVSRTFHGRDIFAPVEAQLSRGTAPRRFGRPLERLKTFKWKEPAPAQNGLKGEIVYVDRFGNAITNFAERHCAAAAGARARVWFKGRPLCVVAEYYQAVPSGKPVAVIGSSGFLEIAVNSGNAAQQHGMRAGDAITLRVG